MRPPVTALALCLLAAACTRAPQSASATAVAKPPPVSQAAQDAHAGHAAVPAPASAPVQLASADVEGRFGDGGPVSVTLHVHDQSGAPMGPDRFQLVHEQKLHVLIVDPSLSDYSHVHPEPIGDGDWRLQFTPQHDRPYRLWLDATPVGGQQNYGVVTINAEAAPVPVDAKLAAMAQSQGIEGKLSFAQPPVAGAMTEGRIELQRDGKPLTALEPVMGTYGHIVGIAQDWQTVAHVHPLGAEPHAPGDRGGPTLRFHLEPKAPGFLKLFAQVRVDGRDVYLPFAIDVGAAK